MGSDRLWEAERTEKGRCVEESWEECQDGEEVELGHDEELGGVEVVPVTELVSENGFDLFGFRLLDQCVKDDNVFALRSVSLEATSDGVRTHGSPKKYALEWELRLEPSIS